MNTQEENKKHWWERLPPCAPFHQGTKKLLWEGGTGGGGGGGPGKNHKGVMGAWRTTKVWLLPQMCQPVRGTQKPTEIGGRVRDGVPEGSSDQVQSCTLVRSWFLCQLPWQTTGIRQTWKKHPLTDTLKDSVWHLEPLSQVAKGEHNFPSPRG